MPEPDTNPLEAFKSFFRANDMNDPRVNAELRQRIAYQMMSQRKAHPKTLGEGLSAIGDAIGDVGMARRLEAADIASQDRTRGDVTSVLGGGQASVTPPLERTAAVTTAALPPVVPSDESAQPPPPTRSITPATPSPLPPDTGGPMASSPPPGQPASMTAPPPGALPTSPGFNDPRARAAFLLASRQAAQGAPPANPTVAGGLPPAGSQAGGGLPSTASPTTTPPAGGDPRMAQAQMAALPPAAPPVNVTPDIRPAPAAPIRREPQVDEVSAAPPMVDLTD